MKKSIIIPVAVLSLSLALFSFAKASKSNNSSVTRTETIIVNNDSSMMDEVSTLSTTLYSNLHLDELGLSKETVEYAVKGYHKLDSEGKVSSQYLTIVDFSQSSRKKRLYIIDMNQQKLVWNTFVSHGKNSGLDMAKRFSNRINSEASSLGFYITGSTYRGKHGLSLRISGLEEGFNDNAEARGVVVHGAAYVNPSRVNSGYMGRSQGCPALPENEYAKVIDIIKDGSVMFLYYPETTYLQSSDLING